MTEVMKVLGVDPGLAATGVGLVTGEAGICGQLGPYAFGSIRTDKGLSLQARLHRIFSEIDALMAREQPDLMVMEDVFILPHYPKSGLILGRVSGVIMLAGARQGVPVIEVTVREVKLVMTGSGNASKAQLERAVRDRVGHPGPIRPNHASDALGLAMTGLYRQAVSGERRLFPECV